MVPSYVLCLAPFVLLRRQASQRNANENASPLVNLARDSGGFCSGSSQWRESSEVRLGGMRTASRRPRRRRVEQQPLLARAELCVEGSPRQGALLRRTREAGRRVRHQRRGSLHRRAFEGREGAPGVRFCHGRARRDAVARVAGEGAGAGRRGERAPRDPLRARLLADGRGDVQGPGPHDGPRRTAADRLAAAGRAGARRVSSTRSARHARLRRLPRDVPRQGAVRGGRPRASRNQERHLVLQRTARDATRSASTTSPTTRLRGASSSPRSVSTRRRSPPRRRVRARCCAACPSGSSAASGSRQTGKRTSATWRSTSRGSATCRW